MVTAGTAAGEAEREAGGEAERETAGEGRGRLSDQGLHAWRGMLVAHGRLIEVLGREMEEACGLPLSSYEVLLHLAESPDGRLRMSDLADRVVLSRSGLTRLVDRLENRGFVRRESCSTDRRGAFAVLTPRGREEQRRAGAVHMRGIQEHFGRHLDDGEAAMIAAVTERLQAGLVPPRTS